MMIVAIGRMRVPPPPSWYALRHSKEGEWRKESRRARKEGEGSRKRGVGEGEGWEGKVVRERT